MALVPSAMHWKIQTPPAPAKTKPLLHLRPCRHVFRVAELHRHEPVVVRPNITYRQLIDELETVTDEEDRQVLVDQLVANLQRSKRRMKDKRAQDFETRSGSEPESLVTQIKNSTPQAVAEWFADKTALIEFLDSKAAGETPPTPT